jgi:hypothetical protein
LAGTDVQDRRNPRSAWPESAFMMAESVFSIGRNRRSRSTGMGVQDGPEYAEIAVAPLLPFGALDQVAPRAARIGQVQALE